MIAVLASRLDPQARALVSEWSGAGAELLSAEDLCSEGWVFHLRNPEAGISVVSGRRVAVRDLRAVLVRRPAMMAEELNQVCSDDRAYVAAELNAFLVAWLSALPCQVVNRPTPNSLCGPAWDAFQWRVAAVRAGLEWKLSPDDADSEIHTVVVCGSTALFAETARERESALELARQAQVDLLAVRFQGEAICGASVAPDLSTPELRQHLLEYLLEAA